MATTYLSPGVYVEEVDRGPKPIQGVSTSVAAFIGFAEKGPINEATLVTNWTQFVDTFGGFLEGAFLPYSVYGYFNNGGNTCYILRLPTTADGKEPAAALPLATTKLLSQAADPVPTLSVTAKEAEQEVDVSVSPSSEEGAPDDQFDITFKVGDQTESFTGLTFSTRRGAKTVVDTINATSTLVIVEDLAAPGSLAERIPAAGTYKLTVPETKALVELDVSAKTFEGDVAERKGIGGLEVIEEITMVCAPDLMSAYQAGALDDTGLKAAQLAMIAHCENMGDRVALLDAPPDMNSQQVSVWRRDDAGYDSKYAALYYPWIEVVDLEGKPLMLPPSGHVAGIYARVDSERGVHKAPANEVVRGALGVENQVTKGEQDILNPMGVNCIRKFPGRGIRVWGARLLSSDPAWRYINVRRLFNYVEESIREGTQWVVFEPNDPFLWGRVTRDVSAFLRTVWRSGALFGTTPEQAFYVKCDEELNPPEVRDQGQLIVEIGMSPVKPAEFVIFRISQWAGGAVGGA
jgi:phage tail sheath protein FI